MDEQAKWKRSCIIILVHVGPYTMLKVRIREKSTKKAMVLNTHANMRHQEDFMNVDRAFAMSPFSTRSMA